jgi:hypothetical protein
MLTVGGPPGGAPTAGARGHARSAPQDVSACSVLHAAGPPVIIGLMLRRLLHLFSSKAKAQTRSPDVRAGHAVPKLPASGFVKVNLEEWDPESIEALRATASKVSDLSFFDQHVEHAYALRAVAGADQCPRCQGATRQHYAHFIYATTEAPRVMMAPAGYFCTACPTVIIDEEMLRSGMTEGFHFQGVLGVDYEGKRPPDLFRTWNGRPAVYVLDDDQGPQGISGIGATPGRHSTRRERKTKQRSKMAKASRKRNRLR